MVGKSRKPRKKDVAAAEEGLVPVLTGIEIDSLPEAELVATVVVKVGSNHEHKQPAELPGVDTNAVESDVAGAAVLPESAVGAVTEGGESLPWPKSWDVEPKGEQSLALPRGSKLLVIREHLYAGVLVHAGAVYEVVSWDANKGYGVARCTRGEGPKVRRVDTQDTSLRIIKIAEV